MKANNKSPEAIAADLGEKYSVGAIRKWESGERVPRPEAQNDLVSYTNGEVMPNDWILPEEALNAS